MSRKALACGFPRLPKTASYCFAADRLPEILATHTHLPFTLEIDHHSWPEYSQSGLLREKQVICQIHPQIMAEFNWQHFLTEYSRQLAVRTQLLDRADVPQTACQENWFGYPPATDEQIANAEKRLAIRLPDDLRAFYRVTNGWMLCSYSIYDIRPVEELWWLSDGSPQLWSLCQVDANPPEDDDERDWWYDQGVKVCRSLILNTRGDDSTLLYDPEADDSMDEQRCGTWAAWNPAMEWTSTSLAEFFQQSRELLSQIDG